MVSNADRRLVLARGDGEEFVRPYCGNLADFELKTAISDQKQHI